MKYHLICGYKRSGKDTFFHKLSKLKNITIDENLDPSQCQESGTHFYILCKPGCLDSNFCFNKKTLIRTAMADMVKEEIHDYFKLNFTSKECAELAKDHLTFYDEETMVYRSLRSYYIEHAMKMRKINPDHWCNKAYVNLLMSDTIQNDHENNDVGITDWRFKNEKLFFEKVGEVKSYRIFRKETNDENFFDTSEHELDNEITDFLVVGSIEDVEVAKKKFPQYYDYKLMFKI